MIENLHGTLKSAMTDLERVRDFQRKIYQKAKQNKDFRFYILYDKVMLPHFLREAYRLCKVNKGSVVIHEALARGTVENIYSNLYLEERIDEGSLFIRRAKVKLFDVEKCCNKFPALFDGLRKLGYSTYGKQEFDSFL